MVLYGVSSNVLMWAVVPPVVPKPRVCASNTIQFKPCCCKRKASVMPVIPPPAMATSYFFVDTTEEGLYSLAVFCHKLVRAPSLEIITHYLNMIMLRNYPALQTSLFMTCFITGN